MSEAGLQVWNTDNTTFQIDGSTPHITMLRKGTVTTTTINFGVGQGTTYAEVSVNPGEILAYRCTAAVAPWGVVDGKQLLVTPTTATQQTIEYWVFSQHQASGVRFGLEVYGPTGALLYDSGRPMMRVIGRAQGNGSFPQDRSTIAVVPYQTNAIVQRDVAYVNVGPNPDYMLVIMQSVGCVAVNGSTVSVSTALAAHNATGPYSAGTGGPSDWVGTFNNGVENRSLVIDTSNL